MSAFNKFLFHRLSNQVSKPLQLKGILANFLNRFRVMHSLLAKKKETVFSVPQRMKNIYITVRSSVLHLNNSKNAFSVINGEIFVQFSQIFGTKTHINGSVKKLSSIHPSLRPSIHLSLLQNCFWGNEVVGANQATGQRWGTPWTGHRAVAGPHNHTNHTHIHMHT